MSLMEFLVNGLPHYSDSRKRYMIVENNKSWVMVSKEIIDQEKTLGNIEFMERAYINGNEIYKYAWLL